MQITVDPQKVMLMSDVNMKKNLQTMLCYSILCLDHADADSLSA